MEQTHLDYDLEDLKRMVYMYRLRIGAALRPDTAQVLFNHVTDTVPAVGGNHKSCCNILKGLYRIMSSQSYYQTRDVLTSVRSIILLWVLLYMSRGDIPSRLGKFPKPCKSPNLSERGNHTKHGNLFLVDQVQPSIHRIRQRRRPLIPFLRLHNRYRCLLVLW